MRRLSVPIFFLLFGVFPLAAQSLDWSSVGSTGAIDESSTALYDFSGRALQFRSGATGTIVARYQVHDTYGAGVTRTPPWHVLWASLSDGATVRLLSVEKCFGAEQTICTITSTEGSGPSCRLCIFGELLNFGTNSYYIETTLTRSSTATNSALNLVALSP
ncbi:MAG TPA: hypothetical protein VJ276_15270 [Thermoanaerobaculia bacterium]|nr:hypothetical protein [Thermoanaerobaculia bacterium]